MPNVVAKINDGSEVLYCDYCKQKIQEGEKYLVVKGEDTDEDRLIHLDCIEIDEETFYEE